jgi:hypothetical protein
MSQIVNIHGYVDEQGALLYEQVRYQPKDFKLRRPDPDKPGQFIWNLRRPDGSYAVRPVPYRLPELIASDTVFIVEGEKDADTLQTHGFCATTNAFGAGNWKDEFNPLFKGKRVIVIPDNDNAGWQRALRIAIGVAPYASKLSILQLDGDVKDVSDWFERSHSAAELSAIVDGRSSNE